MVIGLCYQQSMGMVDIPNCDHILVIEAEEGQYWMGAGKGFSDWKW